MRTLFWGSLGGLMVLFGCGGVLALVDAVPLLQKVLIAIAAAALVSVSLWTLGALRAFVGWLGARRRQQRVVAQRRKDLATNRAYVSRPVTEEDDVETRQMTESSSRGSLSRSEIDDSIEDARGAMHRGDFHGAAELFSDILDAVPDHVDAHLARGRIYLDLGDFNRAMSDFLAAEDLSPASPEPPTAIGDLYFVRKDYERAIDYFDAALQLAPDHPMALCRRGMSHLYRKNFEAALPDLERAHRLDPDIPNLAIQLAQARKGVDPKARSARRR